MKTCRAIAAIGVSMVFALAAPNLGMSQSPVGRQHAAILIPATSIEQAEDVGIRAHTNHDSYGY